LKYKLKDVLVEKKRLCTRAMELQRWLVGLPEP